MKSDMMSCIIVPKPQRASIQSGASSKSPEPAAGGKDKQFICGHSQKQVNLQNMSCQPPRQALILKQNQIQELNHLMVSLSQEVLCLGARLQDFEMRMTGLEARDAESDQPRKKMRRRACDIEKNFKCYFQGCAKMYGSQISLNLHIKLKHKPKLTGEGATTSDKPLEEASATPQEHECSSQRNNSSH